MSWTIVRKLSALTGIGVATALLLTGVAFWGLAHVDEDVDALTAVSNVLRNHMEADMMHEGVKADVLSAMTAHNAQARQRAAVDLAEHSATFRERLLSSREHVTDPEIQALIDEALPKVEFYLNRAAEVAGAVENDRAEADRLLSSFLDAFDDLETSLAALSDRYENLAADSHHAAEATQRTAKQTSLVLLLASLLLGGIASYAIGRSIRRPLSEASAAAESLAGGNLDVALPVGVDDELGRMSQAINRAAKGMRDGLGTVELNWDELGEQRKQVARLEAAVKGAASNMMMIDRDFVVTYCNEASRKLLQKHEAILRSNFPSFSAAGIVGTCIDDFHRNPQHQRRLLADLEGLPRQADIEVGPLRFHLIVNAIVDLEGNYIGNTLEWQDTTQERDALRQISEMISSATEGDLSTRINASDFDGPMHEIADGMNRTLDVVVRPIEAAILAIGSLEDGDLSASMEGDFSGDFAKLRDAMNNTVANLSRMVSQIRAAASGISDGSRKLNSGNSNLHERTQQQAASLEECASTMEELTGSVRQNAESSRQAAAISVEAQKLAEKGGEVVGEAVRAMDGINKASSEISHIISVIDEIASQTNLLALNAAVEAARAGEQGRGFAVVAEEVSSLAGRSAEAAKEIKALIDDSLKRVGEGSRLVNHSGTTLEEIVASVRKCSGIVGEIADAGEEQARGIEEINRALTQMDTMTQQNAVLVEDAVGQSEDMDGQASKLVQLMSFFKLG